MSAQAKYIRVPNKLGALLRVPGGMAREAALAEAGRNVEALCDTAPTVLRSLIGDVENALSASVEPDRLTPSVICSIQDRAESIINYADTFGYKEINFVARSLCKLIVAMQDRDIDGAESVAVHVSALRLVAPGATPQSAEELARLRNQLGRLVQRCLECPLAGSTGTA